mgnify:CR=1 FL=1
MLDKKVRKIRQELRYAPLFKKISRGNHTKTQEEYIETQYTPRLTNNIVLQGRFNRGCCPSSEEYVQQSVGNIYTKRQKPLATLVYLSDETIGVDPVGMFKHPGESLLIATKSFSNSIQVTENHTEKTYPLLRGGIYQVKNWLDKKQVDSKYRVAVADSLEIAPGRLLYGLGIDKPSKQRERESVLKQVDDLLENYTIHALQV